MNDYAYGERNHGPHAVTTANGVEYTYDLNGNLVSTNDGATASWTGFDKPRWLAEAGAGSGFHYNLNRQRVVQHTFTSLPDGATPAFTEKKLYIGSGMEADYSMGSSELELDRVRLYVTTPSGRSGAVEIDADYTAGAKHRRLVYHQDHLGSIDVITEFATTTEYVQAAVAKDWAQPLGRDSRYSYDAWGERRDPSDWIGAPDSTTHGGEDDLTPRGFTDHEMLDGLGLVHMNGRIYDPLLGRFLSADPIIQAPANLQSYNRYSYVMNSPLGYVDPSGYTREEYYNQQTSFSQKRLDKFNAATKNAFGGTVSSDSDIPAADRVDSNAPSTSSNTRGNSQSTIDKDAPTTNENSTKHRNNERGKTESNSENPSTANTYSSLEEAIKDTDFEDTVVITEQFYYYHALDPEKALHDTVEAVPGAGYKKVFGKVGSMIRKAMAKSTEPTRYRMDDERIIEVREGNYFEYMKHRYNYKKIQHVSGFRFRRIAVPFRLKERPFIARSSIWDENSDYLRDLLKNIPDSSSKTYVRVRRYYMYTPTVDDHHYPEMLNEE